LLSTRVPGPPRYPAAQRTKIDPGIPGRSGGGVLEGRAAVGYDHGYDAEVFYLGLALDERYVEGFVEGASRGSGRTTRRSTSCGTSRRRATTTGGSSWRRSGAGWT
jgi:hypothetical protein